MKCIERKIRLSGDEVLFECDLLAIEEGYAILRYVLDEGRWVDGLYLPAETTTLALYFAERNYNLYYWITPADTAPVELADRRGQGSESESAAGEIAAYFNIVEPLALSREEIAYRDLVVDVLVYPDLSARVLDEDELPATIEPELHETITKTRVDLLKNRRSILHEARGLLRPFWPA
jgi:hypothetical protein